MNDQNSLLEAIKEDSCDLFHKHPQEKYRRPHLQNGVDFPIQNFVNLTVHSKILNKDIQLKTFLRLPPSSMNMTINDYKAIIFMHHGLTAHSGTHAYLAIDYALLGCVVVGFDYRGHGQSEGTSGDIEGFQEIKEDALMFMRLTEEYFIKKYREHKSSSNQEYSISDKPSFLNNKFLWGLSLGGYLSYELSREKPLEYKGVILLSPAMKLRIFPYTMLPMKILASLFPKMALLKWLMKESLVQKNPSYFDKPDPLVFNTQVRIRSLFALMERVEQEKNKYREYETPFVIVIPGVDKLVPPIGQMEFFMEAKSKDKQVWYYPNAWHALIDEEEMIEINQRIQNWIKQRINKIELPKF